ncbi:MAG: trehalose-phosphatase [Acidiferrobacter sp.]
MQELATPGVLARFLRQLAGARTRLLVLDYDGTLAPFTDERDQAQLYPGVASLLQQIVDRGTTLAFVTGRSAPELAARLPWPHVEIFGTHGRERLTPDGRLHQVLIPTETLQALTRIDRQLIARGLADTIERKHGALAVHWRRASPPARAHINRQLEPIVASLPPSIVVTPFDGGLEFCSGGVSKGTALTALLADHAGATCAYLGDDQTDEDAFAALPPDGLGLLVRIDWRATRAAVWLRPPEDLLTFLGMWVARSAARP